MWCHDEHDAVAHIDDRQDCDSHREGESDDHACLEDVGYIVWPFGLQEDPYGARNENHDE